MGSYGNGTPPKKAIHNVSAPVAGPIAAPAPEPQYYDEPSYSPSYDTGYDSQGTVAPAAAPQPIPQISEQDWLAGDATYNASTAALQRALKGFEDEKNLNLKNYDTDFAGNLKKLGWDDEDGVDGPLQGKWNNDDVNTSRGKRFQSQLNDFGSRDMLQSSFYGDALTDLDRDFNDQLAGMNTGRQQYRDKASQDFANQSNENLTQQQAARAEAIARLAQRNAGMI